MKLENIKVTMLGTSKSGKTCYMVGMYAMFQMGINGFALNAKNIDLGLQLNDWWDSMLGLENERSWPVPNVAELNKYSFQLSHGLTRPIMGIEWLDYRGGAMSTQKDTVDANDVPGFREFLKDSSCLFICVPGQFLLEPIVKYNEDEKKIDRNKLNFLRQKARVNHIIEYMKVLADSKNPTPNNPFPVVITITMYDYCLERAKTEEGRESIIEDIKEIFNTLFATNSGWLVMICPVSLGSELAGKEDTAEIIPVNIHIPMVFAVYAKLLKFYAMKQQKKDTLSEDLSREKRKNFLAKFFQGDKSGSIRDDLNLTEQELEEILESLDLLAEELQGFRVYLSGKQKKDIFSLYD